MILGTVRSHIRTCEHGIGLGNAWECGDQKIYDLRIEECRFETGLIEKLPNLASDYIMLMALYRCEIGEHV